MQHKIRNSILYSLIASGLITACFYWYLKLEKDHQALEQEVFQYFKDFSNDVQVDESMKLLGEKCRQAKQYKSVWTTAKLIDKELELYQEWIDHQLDYLKLEELQSSLTEYAEFCVQSIETLATKKIIRADVAVLKNRLGFGEEYRDWAVENSFKAEILAIELRKIKQKSFDYLIEQISYNSSCPFNHEEIRVLGQHQSYQNKRLAYFPVVAPFHCEYPMKEELEFNFEGYSGSKNQYVPLRRGLDSVKVNVRRYNAFGDLQDRYSTYFTFWVH